MTADRNARPCDTDHDWDFPAGPASYDPNDLRPIYDRPCRHELLPLHRRVVLHYFLTDTSALCPVELQRSGRRPAGREWAVLLEMLHDLRHAASETAWLNLGRHVAARYPEYRTSIADVFMTLGATQMNQIIGFCLGDGEVLRASDAAARVYQALNVTIAYRVLEG